MSFFGFIFSLLGVIYIFAEEFRGRDARSKQLQQIQNRLAEKETAIALGMINDLRENPIRIGDRVNIADMPATRDAGLSGKTGIVVRAARLSEISANVVGGRFSNVAVNVRVHENGDHWLYSDSVFPVDQDSPCR